MNRSRSFAGLAVAVLLVGAASLAQAQNNGVLECDRTGRLVRHRQLELHRLPGRLRFGAPSSTMAERPPSPPETTSRTTRIRRQQ